MSPISETIRLSRVMCIFFVMFVHVYSGYRGWPLLEQFDLMDVAYRLMAEVLGRSSLPLLTIISGWLLAEIHRPYAKMMRVRVETLIVPLVLWNLLMLATLMVWAELTGDRSDLPYSPMGYANAVTALFAPPGNVPLGFLRDLFVVSALSPLILWGMRRFGLAFLTPFLVLAIVVPHTPIVLRTQILFFFALGIYLHQRGFSGFGRWTIAAFVVVITVTFGWEIAMLARGEYAPQREALDLLNRACISGLVWHAAAALRGTGAGRALVRLEPFTFLAFCSHMLVFRMLAVPGRELFGDLASPLYPVYFFLQPLIAYPAAIMIAWTLRAFPPALLVLNAGRDPWGGGRRRAEAAPRGTKPV